MRDESRKADADSKIMPFHIKEEDTKDPEMDRFVRESLIREADELEKELNSKPELDGIEAPEGLFESIVGELKERGVWEEEDAAYAELSEEDQKALALGRELVRKQETKKRKRYRRRKILKISVIAAACLGVVFGVSMTSAANRRLVKRMWDGMMMDLGFKVNTDYSGEGESVKSKNKEELKAMEKIKEKMGAPTIAFGYLPEGMEYQGYEIANGLDATIFYLYLDKVFYLTVMGVDREHIIIHMTEMLYFVRQLLMKLVLKQTFGRPILNLKMKLILLKLSMRDGVIF